MVTVAGWQLGVEVEVVMVVEMVMVRGMVMVMVVEGEMVTAVGVMAS